MEKVNKEMNQRQQLAVRRYDPECVNVLIYVPHTAVYEFDNISNNWKKSTIAGSLTLYARKGTMDLGIIVLNKKNLDNCIVHFTKARMNVAIKTPYLLTRNLNCTSTDKPENSIKCIWFYDTRELNKIAHTFRMIGVPVDRMEGEVANHQPPQQRPNHINQKTGQHQHKSKKIKPKQETPNLLSMLSQGVMKQKNTNPGQVVSSGINILEQLTNSTTVRPGSITVEELEGPMVAPFPKLVNGGTSGGDLISMLTQAATRPPKNSASNGDCNSGSDLLRMLGNSSKMNEVPLAAAFADDDSANFRMRTVEQIERDGGVNGNSDLNDPCVENDSVSTSSTEKNPDDNAKSNSYNVVYARPPPGYNPEYGSGSRTLDMIYSVLGKDVTEPGTEDIVNDLWYNESLRLVPISVYNDETNTSTWEMEASQLSVVEREELQKVRSASVSSSGPSSAGIGNNDMSCNNLEHFVNSFTYLLKTDQEFAKKLHETFFTSVAGQLQQAYK